MVRESRVPSAMSAWASAAVDEGDDQRTLRGGEVVGKVTGGKPGAERFPIVLEHVVPDTQQQPSGSV